MSLSKKFLYQPKVDTSEESEDSDKLYKGGVRGKRIWLGIVFLIVLYLLTIGNLIALVTVSSSLRLNSFGSLYFSFVTPDTLRLHHTMSVERLLLEGEVQSDHIISLSSLTDVLLSAGTIISDDVGLVSVPSFLALENDSIFSSTITFRAFIVHSNSSDLQMESLSNVSFNSQVRARDFTIISGLQTHTVNYNDPSNTTDFLSITGGLGVNVEGGRGVEISSTDALVSSNNANLVSARINLSPVDSFRILTTAMSDASTNTPQLRLCSCRTGALFLLSTSSNSCSVRGPVGSLC